MDLSFFFRAKYYLDLNFVEICILLCVVSKIFCKNFTFNDEYLYNIVRNRIKIKVFMKGMSI